MWSAPNAISPIHFYMGSLLPVSYLYIDVQSHVSVLCVFQWEGITCHRICGILPPSCSGQTDPCVFISSTPTNDCVFDTDGEHWESPGFWKRIESGLFPGQDFPYDDLLYN